MQPHREGIFRPSPCGGRRSPAVVSFAGAEKGFMRSRWIISAAGSPLVEQFLRRKPRGAAQKRSRRFSLHFQFVPSLKSNLLHPAADPRAFAAISRAREHTPALQPVPADAERH